MKNSNRFVLGLVFAVIGIALFARFIAMNVVRDQASLEGAPIPAVVTGSIGATVAAALPALEVPPKPVVVAGNAATIAAALPLTEPERVGGEGEKLFSEIATLRKGATVSLPLPGGARTEGRINYAKTHPNNATVSGGDLADGSGTFEIAREPWGYRGFILQKKQGIAYVYSSDTTGRLQVARRPIGEVICEPDPRLKPPVPVAPPEPQKAAIYNGGRSVGIINEPVPILHSLPRAAATIYLDFDGEVIEGQSWEGGRRIIANTFNLSATEVTEMWKRVAEDYVSFEVNVTTDLQAYLRAPQGRRMRCIVTPSNFAPGAGGVAFNRTFWESGDTCCWVFMTGKAGTDAIAHEVGHTFNLAHDTTSTAGYYGGHGSGAASWGPIMGAPYGATAAQWSRGDYPDGQQHQDDLAMIGSVVPRRLDDHAGTTAQATPLVLSSTGAVSNGGIIENAEDIDTFIFTTGGGAVNLQFAGAPPSPNLDIEAKLYNSAGTLVTTASPANDLAATLSTTLAAGTYTVTVDGVGNLTWTTGGYDDWGSIGGYSISGTVALPKWRFRIPVNALAGASVGTVAPATGSAYSITAGNTGSAFAINASTGAITVAAPAALGPTALFNLTVSYTAGGSPVSAAVPVSVAPLRGMKQEIWTGLAGTAISNMTSLASYPNSPNLTRYSPSTQACCRLTGYGQKLSAYLRPAETGSHVFWIHSDDSSELWLSTDATPANKVKVAFNTNAVGPGVWTQNAGQQSAAVNLVAGQRYYLEILHRDISGDEYVSVAWQTPSRSLHLIPNENLEYPTSWVNRSPWLSNMTYRIREGSTAGTVVGSLAAGDFEAGSTLSYTITGGNTGNAFALNATTGVLTVNAALNFGTLPKYLLDISTTDTGGLTSTAQIAVEIEALAVKRQVWTGVSGTAITNLTSLATYPNSPNSTTYQALFETPTNASDNFGQKLSGYLRAPDTGSYTFWIASDDEGELWLSTDSNPSNKAKIAYTLNATNSREWGKYATQKSATINLVGGRFYYIEALNKEGAGGDNLAVSWSGPDFGQVMLGAPNVTQQFYNHAAPVLNDESVTIFNRDDIVTTLEAKDWSDPGTQVTYSITGGNADGAFSIDPLTGVIRRNIATLPAGTRVLTITATDNGPVPQSDTALITVQVLKAGLKREVWTGLSSGMALTELTGSLYYPQTPSVTGFTQNFQAPGNYGDNYGQRLSGYLVPPVTGNYTFWIASDDGGELWISSDANPANKRKIASLTGSVNPLQWNAQASQQSIGIPMEAGQYYYIEALQKEGGGGDHLAVAWQGPSIAQAVIPGAYLEYPVAFRPGLKREFFNSSSATKWALNTTTGLMEWSTAAANYIETFAGAGALNGNTTETGTGTWGSSTGWVRNNGVANKAAAGDAHALLPFSPQPGYLYTLSAEIDPVNSPGSADWFALGFTNQPATNTALYTQAFLFPSIGQPWILIRANGSDSGNTMQAFSSALANGITSSTALNAIGAYDTISLVLDTRNTSWVSTYYFNGTPIGTHTHAGSLTIQSIGISSYGGAVGNVRNFRLTSTGGGAPGTLFATKSTGLGEESFSERLTGYILPPATGAYTFWIASDDDGQLLLSTDENPANLTLIASVNGYTAEEAWDVSPSQKSTAKQLVAGKRYYFQVNHRDGSFGDHVAVAWQGPGITRQVIANACLESPSAPADRTLLRREVWSGIAGDNVSALTSAAAYPTSLSTTGTLTANAGFVAPSNTADTFGERVSGYLVAPEDGRYTFWIASDDGGELWLSTDENPANRIKIASVSGSVAAQAWDTQASQKSVPIALVTGRRYYLEALHKEGAGTDHLAVAWQGPSFARRVIANGSLENPFVLPGKPTLKREVWTGISGTAVSNLTSSSGFLAAKPNARGALTTFEAPVNYGDNFGERVTGFLVAPESGNFKFWIASDDASELWLSTDSNPANRIKIAFTTGATPARGWTSFPSQESGTLILTAGQRYHIEVLHKEGAVSDHMAVAWQGPSFSRQVIDGRFLEYPGAIPAPAALKREVWTGIGGNNVTDLTNTATYPASPNQILTLDTFETPINASDNYGQKVSGYLIAPVTGNYQFWIASDDGGELWLSTSDIQANKTRIAYTTNATGVKNWTNNASQASAIITLAAGQRCYIEALHKEGGGDDYMQVAWQGPGFTQQIIGSQFLEYPGLPPAPTQGSAIIAPTGIDPGYTFWLSSMGLQGNNRLANADPDGDRIPNSLEFILGGLPSGTGSNSMALLPKISADPYWATFEFRRADVALAVDPFVQFGTTLADWTRANDGVGGVQITVVDDGFGPGVDRVIVRIPRNGLPEMFFRLNSKTP